MNVRRINGFWYNPPQTCLISVSIRKDYCESTYHFIITAFIGDVCFLIVFPKEGEVSTECIFDDFDDLGGGLGLERHVDGC